MLQVSILIYSFNSTLIEIESLLDSHNKRLDDFPPMLTPNVNMLLVDTNRLIAEELNYDRVSLAQEFMLLMPTMTIEQHDIYDTIILSAQNDSGGLYFISGFGGSRKTYIWRALVAFLRSKGEIVLAVASCGIAALLIRWGRTTH